MLDHDANLAPQCGAYICHMAYLQGPRPNGEAGAVQPVKPRTIANADQAGDLVAPGIGDGLDEDECFHLRCSIAHLRGPVARYGAACDVSGLAVAGFSGRRDLSLPIPETNDVANLAGLEHWTLTDSSFFTALRERTSGLGSSHAEAFSQVLGRIAERYGASTLAFGSWHGDWAPWNMAWHRGRLFVWDWERSHQHVPVGFDALHYFFQVARTMRREGVRAAADASLAHVSTLSRALNVSRGSEELVLTLYLLTLFLRYEEGGGLRAQGATDISWALLAEAAARVDRWRPRRSRQRGRGHRGLRLARRCHGAQP